MTTGTRDQRVLDAFKGGQSTIKAVSALMPDISRHSIHNIICRLAECGALRRCGELRSPGRTRPQVLYELTGEEPEYGSSRRERARQDLRRAKHRPAPGSGVIAERCIPRSYKW